MSDEFPVLHGYGRVSGRQQEKAGTIEAQLAEWHAYAAAGGFALGCWYPDMAVSGEAVPLSEREAGARLVEDARQGRISHLWFYNEKRLGRTMIDTLVEAARLTRAGVTLHFSSSEYGDDPVDELMFAVRAWVAQEDNRERAELTKKSRRNWAEKGYYVGGTVPLGYTAGPPDAQGRRRVVIHPQEAALVRRIFELYLDDTPDGGAVGLLKVARILNREGIPTMTQRRDYAQSQDEPTEWTDSTVHYILMNETYTGRRLYGGRLCEWPAIIDEATFERTRETLAGRKIQRRHGRPYVLRSLIRCELCDDKYYGTTFNNSNGYFYSYYRHHHHRNVRDCPNKQLIRADLLEAWAWSHVQEVLADPDAAIQRAAQSDHHAHLQAHLEAELKQLENEADTLSRGTRALLRQLGQFPDLADSINAQLAEQDRRLRTNRHSIERVKKQLADNTLHERRLASLRAKLHRRRSLATTSDPEKQRELCSLVIERVVVGVGEEGQFRFRLVLNGGMGMVNSWEE